MLRRHMIIGLKNIIFAAMLGSAVLSCGAESRMKTVTDAESGLEMLEMPSVPADLVAPAERAGYLAAHFWDNMDFSDGKYASDASFIEHNLVNYLSVLPIADEDSARAAIHELYVSASENPAALSCLDELIETYLYSYDSPMYNEELFALFVDERLGSGLFDSDVDARNRMLMESLLKNKKGSAVSDFEFVTADETLNTLLGALDKTSKNILIFYDPECEDCHTAIRLLSLSPRFSDINFIAIYDGGDKSLWESDLVNMPSGWIIGMTENSVEESGLFELPASPTIYVIAPDGKVLAKNIVMQNLMGAEL